MSRSTHGTVRRRAGNGGSISMANLNLKFNCGVGVVTNKLGITIRYPCQSDAINKESCVESSQDFI